MFSFIMSNLLDMIERLKRISEDFNQETELDKFFHTLTRFNGLKPLDAKIISEITNYLKQKWSHDKTNFLVEEQDYDLFSQLPQEVKNMIFTEFVFKDFV